MRPVAGPRTKTAHFKLRHLIRQPAKGLTGATGVGQGDWRLELTSDIDIEVLSFIRTNDGFLTSMHDHAPREADGYRIPIFNPGSNRMQESLLRLVNPGQTAAMASITGTDDAGAPGTGTVSEGTCRPGGKLYRNGAGVRQRKTGLKGRWATGGQVAAPIGSGQPVVALSLLRPRVNLANLSARRGMHRVSSSEFARGPQGFVPTSPITHTTVERRSNLCPPTVAPVSTGPRSALFISESVEADACSISSGTDRRPCGRAALRRSCHVEIATDTPAGCFGSRRARRRERLSQACCDRHRTAPCARGLVPEDENSQSANSSHSANSVAARLTSPLPWNCGASVPRTWERKCSRSLGSGPDLRRPLAALAVFGVDSGFEGRTDIYFTRAAVDLQPM